MAFLEQTYTFDAVRCPEVVLVKSTSQTTGQVIYKATINLLELDPVRTITAEELDAGITSLNPPTVQAQIPQDLINLAIRACGSAYENTDGLTMSADVYASLGYSVPHAVAGALRLAGVDI